MSEALDLPAKESWQLLLLTNVVTSEVLGAYTNLDSDYPFESNTFTSVTDLEIVRGENSGTLEASPWEFRIRMVDAFLSTASSGLPVPWIRAEVIEITKGSGGSVSTLRPFRGYLTHTKRNPSGARDYVGLIARNSKALLEGATLGTSAMHTCVNTLGDLDCKVDMTSLPNIVTVTLSTIVGRLVTLASLMTGRPDRFYERGSLTVDGLEIRIREWRNEVEGDRLEVWLAETPPTSWVGATASLRAGCSKDKEACDTLHANLDNFKGVGYAMPPYHPVYENGGSRQ